VCVCVCGCVCVCVLVWVCVCVEGDASRWCSGGVQRATDVLLRDCVACFFESGLSACV
jgi:hypothetical protein